MYNGGPRLVALAPGVAVEKLDVLVWQADTDLHTVMLPLVGCSAYHGRTHPTSVFAGEDLESLTARSVDECPLTERLVQP